MQMQWMNLAFARISRRHPRRLRPRAPEPNSFKRFEGANRLIRYAALAIAFGAPSCRSANRNASEVDSAADLMPDQAPALSVCNDSSTVRIHARVELPRSSPQVAIFQEIGERALWIDGKCNFWVHDYLVDLTKVRGHAWPVVRTGTLTRAEADDIGRRLETSTWAERDGQPPQTVGFDAPWIDFTDGQHVVRVGLLCTGCEGRIPPDMERLQSAFFKVLQELSARAVPPESFSPLRVTCVSAGIPAHEVVKWPLRLAIDSVAASGHSQLIDSADEVARLTELRKTFQGGNGEWDDVAIATEGGADGGVLSRADYLLQIRDTLPFEAATGGFPLQW
jgi:hypothetical protein